MEPAAIEVHPPDTNSVPTVAAASTRLGHNRKPSLQRTQDSRENLHRRNKSRTSKGNVNTPVASSPASHGREFRVGNVGNNGLIYLRPVKKSSPETFAAGPSPALLPSRAAPPLPAPTTSQWRESLASATSTRHSILSTSSPRAPVTSFSTLTNHRRTRSASKPDTTPSLLIGDTSSGAVKVIIDRTNQQPTTVTGKPLDHLAIPHYRLGVPHFTDKGSAILNSSIQTSSSQKTESQPEAESKQHIRYSPQQQSGESQVSKFKTSRSEKSTTSGHKLPPSALKRSLRKVQSREEPPKTSQTAHNVVKVDQTPLVNSQDHDVRISPSTGKLLAASIPQLIAQVTSPKLLDYDLLSDFFLTYRIFMTANELASRLIERLHDAICSSDEFSRIVRVRTFVALRHWILNYFVDDFVANLNLRVSFCTLVNDLCAGLQRDAPERVGDIRILTELKKCWRHTCALFWDMPGHQDTDDNNVDIVPGGIAGSRSILSDINGNLYTNAHVDPLAPPTENSLRGSSPQSAAASSNVAFNQTSKLSSLTASSASSLSDFPGDERQSMQAMSCSIPASTFTGVRRQRGPSLGPRPVPPIGGLQKQTSQPPPTMENPKKHHSRSGSFSDALRDDRAPLPAPKDDSEEVELPPSTIPGSLIRGATVSPYTPYVETVIPTTPIEEGVSMFRGHGVDGEQDQRGRPNQPSNPGVRRFIGSVRRALSAKNAGQRLQSLSPRRESPSRDRLGNSPFRTPLNRDRSAQKRKLVDGRAALRIDLLAAEVSEAFRTAVQEVQQAQEAFQIPTEPSALEVSNSSTFVSNDVSRLRVPEGNQRGASVTTGSRSIVIMDDTNGQMTPRPDDPLLSDSFGPVHSHVSSAHYSQGAIHSVPIFLDQGQSVVDQAHDGASSTAESSFVELGLEAEPCKSPSRPHQLERAEEGVLTVRDPLREPLDVPNTSRFNIAVGQEHASSTDQHSCKATMVTTENTQSSIPHPAHLERVPGRPLRRLPGGNLKAANHVHSLDDHAQADFSIALGNVLHSPVIPPRTSSTNARVLYSGSEHPERNEDGTQAQNTTSQPALRPSFEREVAKLADIPDKDNESGIESALAKLEGRGRDPPSSPRGAFSPAVTTELERHSDSDNSNCRHEKSCELSANHSGSEDLVGVAGPTPRSWTQERMDQRSIVVKAKPVSMAETIATQSSTPLLERGASHPPKRRPSPTIVVEPASQSGSQEKNELDQDSQQTATTNMPGSEDSYELIDEDESLRKARAGKKLALTAENRQSFFLNENESLSELSSLTPDDLSEQSGLKSPGMHSFFEDEADSGRDTPRQPGNKPTRDPSRSPARLRRPGNPLADTPSDEFQVDPAYVPGSRPITQDKLAFERQSKPRSAEDLFNAHAREAPLARSPATTHLPFILAHDSLALAQQLTVIERDALCEIDWRDLIHLRWNQSAMAYYNWVDYLRSNSGVDPQNHQTILRPGVDMCIARFNLVVRWVKSEVVLTQDMSERAATIVKYIHIAQHSRRLRNWATMYQIAMALMSADLSRLKQTWSMVPEEERATLAELEDLIMPKRNFNNLRIEIETATSTWAQGGEGGCIPFIGIYTHDLIYNAQKPAKVSKKRLDPSEERTGQTGTTLNSDSSSLINFERHHTAATIVKDLLRLIEASSKYTFQAENEMSSRCLWIGALHDTEVTRRSKELERFERSSG